MFSKNHFRNPLPRVIGFLLGIMTVSCAPSWEKNGPLPLMQKPEANRGSLVVRGNDSQCLAGFPEQIDRFFNGRATEVEVRGFWTCSGRAVRLFSDYIRGRDDDRYSAGELRAFLHIFFLGDLRISDELMVQMMTVKQVFLGGARTHLTRSELQGLVRLFSQFQDVTLRLRPHMGLIVQDHKNLEAPRPTPLQVEEARTAMLSAAQIVGQLLARSRITYEMSDFHSLLREMGQLRTARGPWQGPQTVLEFMPLLRTLRVALTASPRERIRPQDWEQALLRGARVYAQFLRFQYTMDRRQWPDVDLVARIAEFSLETLDLVEAAVLAQPDQFLPFERIDELIDELDRRSMVPFGLPASVAKFTIRPLVQRYLRDNESAAVRAEAERGVGRGTLTIARREIRNWIANQLAIHQQVGRQALPRVRDVAPEFSPDMSRLLANPWRTVLQEDGRVRVEPPSVQRPWDVYSLSQLNWRRQFARMALQGYALNPQQILESGGVRREEFRIFHNDIRHLARHLGILDPREPGIWKSVFMQGDMFVSTADADGLLSLPEAVELITLGQSVGATNRGTWDNMVLQVSSGSVVFDMAIPDPNSGPQPQGGPRGWGRRSQAAPQNPQSLSAVPLERRVGRLGPRDVFGRPMMDPMSFRQMYRERFQQIYSHLPNMSLFFGRLSAADQLRFVAAMEEAGRCMRTDSQSWVESSDMDKMSMMLHLVETVFLRMDVPEIDVLVRDEINTLFPLVRPLLADSMPSWMPESGQRGIFYYMLENGERPGRWGAGYWAAWESVASTRVRATRMNFARMMALVRRETPTWPVRSVTGRVYQPSQFCGAPDRWPEFPFPVDTED